MGLGVAFLHAPSERTRWKHSPAIAPKPIRSRRYARPVSYIAASEANRRYSRASPLPTDSKPDDAARSAAASFGFSTPKSFPSLRRNAMDQRVPSLPSRRIVPPICCASVRTVTRPNSIPTPSSATSRQTSFSRSQPAVEEQSHTRRPRPGGSQR